MVPIGTSHLWLLRVRTHHSSASIHLSLLVGAQRGIVAAFCLHIIQVKALGQVVQSLLRKRAFELAPLSSLGYYSRLFYIKKALGSWRPILNLSLLCARYIILKEVYLLFPMHPYSGYFIRFMAFGKVFQFLILCLGLSTASLVFTRVMALVRSFLHSLGFGFGLICTTGKFRHPPESRFSFSEDVPLVVQFSRNSRRLGEVSACGASVVISSLESYWTLSVSGLLQPGNESTSFSQLTPCFYHEWIYPHFLARVDEDAVLSDCSFRSYSCGCGRSGCSSSALGPLRFRGSCAVVFGDPTGSFLVVGPRAARACQLARVGVSPVDLWSDSSNVGWSLVSTLFGVPSGP